MAAVDVPVDVGLVVACWTGFEALPFAGEFTALAVGEFDWDWVGG